MEVTEEQEREKERWELGESFKTRWGVVLQVQFRRSGDPVGS